jgi:hypothetical protein
MIEVIKSVYAYRIIFIWVWYAFSMKTQILSSRLITILDTSPKRKRSSSWIWIEFSDLMHNSLSGRVTTSWRILFTNIVHAWDSRFSPIICVNSLIVSRVQILEIIVVIPIILQYTKLCQCIWAQANHSEPYVEVWISQVQSIWIWSDYLRTLSHWSSFARIWVGVIHIVCVTFQILHETIWTTYVSIRGILIKNEACPKNRIWIWCN